MPSILGISPLDRDSTVCLVRDGQIVAAIAEERLSRQKMHRGFPYLAMAELFQRCALKAEDIDVVAYGFLPPEKENELKQKAYDDFFKTFGDKPVDDIFTQFRALPKSRNKDFHIPGLEPNSLQMRKPWFKSWYKLAYRMASKVDFVGTMSERLMYWYWLKVSAGTHQKYFGQLVEGLQQYGLLDKLQTIEHHHAHACNAYYTSGFDEAIIFTLDGYGSGLGGSISIGRNGTIERVHDLKYPMSMGEFYASATASLGYYPWKHAGKVLGLAAHDSPDFLYDAVRSLIKVEDGDVYCRLPHNVFFARHLAVNYPKPTVAAAYQKVLEEVACSCLAYYQKKYGIKNLVGSGGVFANVKANQRMLEVPGIENIFVHPDMGDGGCCVGAALAIEASESGLQPFTIDHVYWGPEYSEQDMASALREAGLEFQRHDQVESRIAQLLHEGNIVARFNGPMEYGPRALGNRSILYHAKDPDVNLWLNQQLRRTEYMPFAPATLYEEAEKCYKGLKGGEHAAEFMTITFDCTDFMMKNCPAAVHVDGTARPQLVRKESNESFYKIIKEYQKLTGIPSIINTSFNMHEEPIVCRPQDAIRAFQQGNLHYLAMGPFLVKGKLAKT